MSGQPTPSGRQPARHEPPRSGSRVYAWSFDAALILWIIGTERFMAAATGSSASAVVAAWWSRGSDRIVLSFVWAAAAFAFAGLAAAMARHLFIAATGRPEPYILLGAAEDGFHAVHERTRPWTPSFVPCFIGAPPAVTLNRQAVYRRLWLLADGEGNLTPVAALGARRAAGLALLEGLAIAIGALPCIVVAGSHFDALDTALRVPQAWARLQLPEHALVTAVATWALVNATIVVLIGRRPGGSLRDDRVLPLPAPLTTCGAVLAGTVIDVVDVAGPTSPAKRWPSHYRRYTVQLDGPEFPLPVYVRWEARRIHWAELSDASQSLRRELQRARAGHEAIFKVLDDAMANRTPVRWRVTDEMALVPDIAGTQVWDEESGAQHCSPAEVLDACSRVT